MKKMIMGIALGVGAVVAGMAYVLGKKVGDDEADEVQTRPEATGDVLQDAEQLRQRGLELVSQGKENEGYELLTEAQDMEEKFLQD